MNESQNKRLLHRLRNGSVTQIQALGELGILRLASRINDLKNAGYSIAKRTVKVSNRFGEPCRVAEYSLGELSK